MSRGVKQDDDASQYWDLVRRIERLEAVQESLVPITFATNWTNYATSVPDASQALCGSWIDKSGNVHVQGLARRVTASWTGGVAVGTVASRHWPAKNHGFTSYMIDGVGARSLWRTTVDATGVIFLQDAAGGGTANGGIGSIVYLDSIFYRLDA